MVSGKYIRRLTERHTGSISGGSAQKHCGNISGGVRKNVMVYCKVLEGLTKEANFPVRERGILKKIHKSPLQTLCGIWYTSIQPHGMKSHVCSADGSGTAEI